MHTVILCCVVLHTCTLSMDTSVYHVRARMYLEYGYEYGMHIHIARGVQCT